MTFFLWNVDPLGLSAYYFSFYVPRYSQTMEGYQENNDCSEDVDAIKLTKYSVFVRMVPDIWDNGKCFSYCFIFFFFKTIILGFEVRFVYKIEFCLFIYEINWFMDCYIWFDFDL